MAQVKSVSRAQSRRQAAETPPSAISLKRQLLFWIGALAVFIALLWLLSDVLLPFVAGMALAYLLDPLVQRLQNLGIHRAVAAIIIVAVFALAFGLALVLLLPVLGEQIAHFAQRLPELIERVRALLQQSSEGWLGDYVGERLPDAQKSFGTVASTIAGWITAFIGQLWSGGKALISILSIVIITPIVAFYLLLDRKSVV